MNYSIKMLTHLALEGGRVSATLREVGLATIEAEATVPVSDLPLVIVSPKQAITRGRRERC